MESLENVARLVMPRTRPVRIPPGLRTVTVGGATLGGSGKTRVAIAVAKELARRGERVVLIGHAYRARPGRARVVAANDLLAEVGDEAVVCARALDGIAKVVVAPSRQAAVDHAAPMASVLVFDGPLQLRPAPASLSILAVDVNDASPARSLVAYVDAIMKVDARLTESDRAQLRGKRFGLFTAIARPRRLVDALRRDGLLPTVAIEAPDHGPLSRVTRRALATAEVDLWVATPKCAMHLEGSAQDALSAPMLALTCLDPPGASALTLRSTP